MILLSSLVHVPRPSYPFRGNFERSAAGKRTFTEKAKIVNRGSQCSPRESTCSKLQYDPYLISYRVLIPSYPFQKDLGHKVKGSFPKKLKILVEVP